MPNWITNIVTPTNKGDWGKLKELLVNDVGAVDFNKVFPVNSDLQIVAGSYEYINPNGYVSSFSQNTLDKQEERITPVLSVIYNDTISQEDYVLCFYETQLKDMKKVFKEVYSIHDVATKNGIENILNIVKGYFNLRRYGYVNCYEAQNTKWGTKWNACESHIDENTMQIEFDTAYSCPFPILGEISKSVPLTVAFADSDIGSNCGLITIENEECMEYASSHNENSKVEGVALALLIKGYDIESYLKYYTDEEIQESFSYSSRDEMVSDVLQKQSEICKVMSDLEVLI